MRTMHLFAGIGGGLLADLILGHTPVVAVEWEPYACQVLRERATDGWFPDLQVWEGDVRLFDPSEYTGKVGCIHAGFPCQDISVAGKQAGVGEGTRSGLYREVLRIAGIVRPRYLFLENVAAIKSKGLEQVIKDLAIMGYDTRWLCIRASDVGAPHHRDRWFALAYTNIIEGRQLEVGRTDSSDCTEREGLRGVHFSDEWQLHEQEKQVLADTISQRQPGSGQPISSVNSTPTGDGQAVDVVNGGQPGFWSVESNVGRVANGVPHRVHKLKGLGNAQVPLQAAVAYKILSKGLL